MQEPSAATQAQKIDCSQEFACCLELEAISDPRPPRKHHYLPRWYLSRWERDGKIWEFSRRGPRNELHVRYRSPSSTGYQRDLYTVPGRPAEEAASIEKDFLQVIDDRGAKALDLAENEVRAGPADKAGLVQFLLSMLHRAPERIARLEQMLISDLEKELAIDPKHRAIFRRAALNVFCDLVQSKQMLARLMSLSTFIIAIGEGGHDLLTGDMPLMMSNGLAHKDAFVILPIGPRKIIVLAENRSIPDHLVDHGPKVLSKAINDATCLQAAEIVIGPNDRQTRFVDNRLGLAKRLMPDAIDPITGIFKWKI